MSRRLPLLLGLLALLLALLFGGATLVQGAGDAAALKEIMGDGPARGAGWANAYMSGLAAYTAGDYAGAANLLAAALPTHGPFARRWLALSLERAGDPAAGRAALDVADDAELALYGDILLREWPSAAAADKAGYLALLQARKPAAILPYANRLIAAGYPAEAEGWAQAMPDFNTSPDALVTLGSALYAQGRLQEAKPLLGRAYALRADAVTAYWYGTVLSESEEPEAGAALLTEAATSAADTPLLPWMLRAMAVGFARGGRCAEADAAFDRAAASDGGAENQARVAEARALYGEQCRYAAAWRAYEAGDAAGAAALVEAAVAAYGEPARRQQMLNLGMTGRAGEALAALDLAAAEDRTTYGDVLILFWPQLRAAQRADSLAQLRAQAPALLGPLALRLYDRQEYADAVAWANAALEDGSSPEALLVLGQDAFRQEDLASAEEWFGQAYAQRAQTDAHTATLTAYWYGRTLALGPEPQRGAPVLEATIAAMAADDRLLPWVLRELGIGQARSGECAAAAATFARAVALDPGAENQGRIADAVGEYGAACTPPLTAPTPPATPPVLP